MTKVSFQNLIKTNSLEAYKTFSNRITQLVNHNRGINMDVFCRNYGSLANTFSSEERIPEFTKLSKTLMEFLVSKNFDTIASIICSALVKLNDRAENSKIVEDLAVRGMAIAKRNQDIVHIAARANDINRILRFKNPGSKKHLKYLQIQNEALKEICRNYDSDRIQHYKMTNIDLAPIENYEMRLFHVKLDIATYTFFKDPKYAIYEYEEAKVLYEKNKDKYSEEMVSIAEKRIKTIEEKIKKLKIIL